MFGRKYWFVEIDRGRVSICHSTLAMQDCVLSYRFVSKDVAVTFADVLQEIENEMRLEPTKKRLKKLGKLLRQKNELLRRRG